MVKKNGDMSSLSLGDATEQNKQVVQIAQADAQVDVQTDKECAAEAEVNIFANHGVVKLGASTVDSEAKASSSVVVQLVVISGRSGSGKTVALRALEDLGYYCIDNLPVHFLRELTKLAQYHYPKLAVSIDIRNMPDEEEYFGVLFNHIKHDARIHTTVIFCDADDQVLIKRYSETRRLHPLSRHNLSLSEAIILERTKLTDISGYADLRIDTSELSVHQLSQEVVTAITGQKEKRLVMVFESFGFKYGIAKDADFVFDARFLPNPYWEKTLRNCSGLDEPVKQFFARYPSVDTYINQIDELLMYWIQDIESSNRSYLTIAVGCTGGYHRSVYIAQCLADRYSSRGFCVQVRHRSLNINANLEQIAKVQGDKENLPKADTKQ